MASQRILVIEDSEHDREIYGKLLWYNGYEVTFAVDGEEGLWLARQAPPDLILLDLRLPDLDGLDLCRALKGDERTAMIPVVVLSGKSQRDFGEEAERAGCACYIEKPTRPLNVVQAVEHLIGPAPTPAPPRQAGPTPEPEAAAARRGGWSSAGAGRRSTSPRAKAGPAGAPAEPPADAVVAAPRPPEAARAPEASQKPTRPRGPAVPNPARPSARPPAAVPPKPWRPRLPASRGVLNPFEVYAQGAARLQQQLLALDAPHLRDIAREYRLLDEDAALEIESLGQAALAEAIVARVGSIAEGPRA